MPVEGQIDNKNFYRHCEKTESGECTNSKTYCGIKFKYMSGSDSESIRAFMNDISFMSCKYLQRRILYPNTEDRMISNESYTQLHVLHVVIGLQGVIIVLLLVAIGTYFGVRRYKKRTQTQVMSCSQRERECWLTQFKEERVCSPKCV